MCFDDQNVLYFAHYLSMYLECLYFYFKKRPTVGKLATKNLSQLDEFVFNKVTLLLFTHYMIFEGICADFREFCTVIICLVHLILGFVFGYIKFFWYLWL